MVEWLDFWNYSVFLKGFDVLTTWTNLKFLITGYDNFLSNIKRLSIPKIFKFSSKFPHFLPTLSSKILKISTHFIHFTTQTLQNFHPFYPLYHSKTSKNFKTSTRFIHFNTQNFLKKYSKLPPILSTLPFKNIRKNHPFYPLYHSKLSKNIQNFTLLTHSTTQNFPKILKNIQISFKISKLHPFYPLYHSNFPQNFHPLYQLYQPNFPKILKISISDSTTRMAPTNMNAKSKIWVSHLSSIHHQMCSIMRNTN